MNAIKKIEKSSSKFKFNVFVHDFILNNSKNVVVHESINLVELTTLLIYSTIVKKGTFIKLTF